MGKRVVLIQDDSDCREIMGLILEGEGFEVITLNTAQVLNNPPDFDMAIVDEYAESKTGCEICMLLKENYTTSSKPVLFTSTRPGIEKRAEVCKADNYMAKPFDISHFANLVKSFFYVEALCA